MKLKLNSILLITAMLIVPFIGKSQLQIVPYAGYNFGAKTSFYQGEVRLRSNATYGINLSYLFDGENGIDFTYSFTSTTMEINNWNPTLDPDQQSQSSKVDVHYYMIGAKRVLFDGMAKPYVGLQVGGVTFAPQNKAGDYYSLSSVTRFSFGFHAGVDLMFTEHIGIFARIRALVPVQWGGVGFGISCGGGGCGTGAGVSVGSTFISGDITGGLVVQLGG